MIRRTIPIISILFIIAVAACSRPIDSRLIIAESEMLNHPDSSLSILNSIDRESLNCERDRQIYSILHTEASYKCFIDETSDSTISVAAEYFDNNEYPIYRLKAYLYKGIILNTNKRYADAMIALHEAEKSAVHLKDSYFSAIIHRALGDSFDGINNPRVALPFYRKAFDEFNESGSTDYIPDAYYDISRMYMNLNVNDSCIFFADAAIKTAVEHKDTSVICCSLSAKAQSYLFQNDYKSVIHALEKKRSLNQSKIKANDIENLGLAYLEIGEIQKAKKSDSILGVLSPSRKMLSWRIAQHEGDYKKAFYDYVSFSESNFNIYKGWVNRNQEVSLFDSYGNLDTLSSIEVQKKNFWIWILSLSSLIFILCVFIAILLWRKEKYKNDKLIRTLSDVNSELFGKDDTIRQLQNEKEGRDKVIEEAKALLSESLKAQFSLLDNLMKEYYENPDDRGKEKRIIETVNKTVKQMGNNRSMLSNLINIVNTRLDNLINDFDKDFPDLSSDEKKLFLYSVIGLSGKSAGFLMGITDDNVYTRKRNLRLKLKKNKDASPRYLKFL